MNIEIKNPEGKTIHDRFGLDEKNMKHIETELSIAMEKSYREFNKRFDEVSKKPDLPPDMDKVWIISQVVSRLTDNEAAYFILHVEPFVHKWMIENYPEQYAMVMALHTAIKNVIREIENNNLNKN